MAFKTGLAIGFGAGYVLGSRAGRERYEDIRRMWGQVTGSPTVHRAAERTKELAEVGAKRGMHAMQRGVDRAGTAVRERLDRDGDATTQIVDLASDQEGRQPEESQETVDEALLHTKTPKD